MVSTTKGTFGDPSTVSALSQAFYPGTVEGIADELYAILGELWSLPAGVMNPKHNELAKRRDHLESVLLAHMKATGEVVRGRTAPPCRIVPRVQFDKRPR